MQQYFYDLAAFLDTCIQGNEQYQCWFAAEASDFVRFNKSAIRQPGHVRQIYLTLHLIDGLRHAGSRVALTGHLASDHALLTRMINEVRTQLPELPDDPHFLISTKVHSTEHCSPSHLPDTSVIVDAVLEAARGYDLVGILAAGPIYRGFANSFGQRNWHAAESFNLDWSLYHSQDRAVKTIYAGFEWSTQQFIHKFHDATEQLAKLKQEPISIKPGGYRAYLTPTALYELISMLNWAGLSEKALRTKQSSVCRMRDEGLRLHPMVTLKEDTANGLAPAFQENGFIKPDEVVLIDRGQLTGSLVSPRTAKEYGIGNNGANSGEAMLSIDLGGGDLPMADVLKELDTGVFISNLWYLNFSDRANCRITGMTRFATFWVENGEIKAPLNVMRFDDSLFRVLGRNLIGLTRERELLIDTDTYQGRSTNSARLPGALTTDFRFVL